MARSAAPAGELAITPAPSAGDVATGPTADARLDRRFSVRPEYCGYRARRYVARFCGEWIGEAKTRGEARTLARIWREQRF